MNFFISFNCGMQSQWNAATETHLNLFKLLQTNPDYIPKP